MSYYETSEMAIKTVDRLYWEGEDIDEIVIQIGRTYGRSESFVKKRVAVLNRVAKMRAQKANAEAQKKHKLQKKKKK